LEGDPEYLDYIKKQKCIEDDIIYEEDILEEGRTERYLNTIPADDTNTRMHMCSPTLGNRKEGLQLEMVEMNDSVWNDENNEKVHQHGGIYSVTPARSAVVSNDVSNHGRLHLNPAESDQGSSYSDAMPELLSFKNECRNGFMEIFDRISDTIDLTDDAEQHTKTSVEKKIIVKRKALFERVFPLAYRKNGASEPDTEDLKALFEEHGVQVVPVQWSRLMLHIKACRLKHPTHNGESQLGPQVRGCDFTGGLFYR